MVLLYFDVFWRTISKSRWKTWLFCENIEYDLCVDFWRLENFDTRQGLLITTVIKVRSETSGPTPRGVGNGWGYLGRLGSSNPINPLLWSIICSMNIAISRHSVWLYGIVDVSLHHDMSWYVPICVGYTFRLTLLVQKIHVWINPDMCVWLNIYIHTIDGILIVSNTISMPYNV